MKDLYDAIEFQCQTDEDVDNLLKNKLSDISSLVIVGYGTDFKTSFYKNTLNKFLEKGIAITCLSLDKPTMLYLFGIHLAMENYVIMPYKNSLYINLIGIPNIPANVITDKKTGTTKQYGNTTINKIQKHESPKSNKNSYIRSNFINPTPIDIANEIENLLDLYKNYGIKLNTKAMQSNISLPPGQSKNYYLSYNSTYPLPYTDFGQYFNNNFVLKVDLIASYDNPPYKYLQITNLGAGCNPTDGKGMYWNDEYNRGWWQNYITITFETDQKELTVLETSPKNINNQTQYKTSSSFDVSVNISENPKFDANYKYNSEYSSIISDFEIVNRSSGKNAEWNFQCSLSKDPWNMFNDRFILKPSVKELPPLATQNLQPTCLVLWYTENSYNGVAELRYLWDIDYKHAYSQTEGLGWNSYIQSFKPGPYLQFVSVDFSQVQA